MNETNRIRPFYTTTECYIRSYFETTYIIEIISNMDDRDDKK